MLSDDEPMRVPVNINWWRWPVRVDRVECGECGEVLRGERFTALSELADTVGDHAGNCAAP